MLISATAQSVTTSSSSMTASPWAQQVPFNIADEGQQFNFATGMGGWSDIQFAYKQRNWVGKHAKVARLNFFGRNNTSGVMATELSEEQLKAAYKEQLEIYAKACSKLLSLPVGEKIIYSFSLNKSINL